MIWPKVSLIRVSSFSPFLVHHIIKAFDNNTIEITNKVDVGSSTYLWFIWAGMKFRIVAYFEVVQSIAMQGGAPTDEFTFAVLQGTIEYPSVVLNSVDNV